MKLFPLLLIAILAIPAVAQVEFVPQSFFPPEDEFPGLHIDADKVFENPSGLSNIPDGSLIADVGFSHYARRTYSTGTTSTLILEAITLTDSRAAYSLLTLLRDAPMQDGPPGDSFSLNSKGMIFAQNKEFIRIRAEGISDDLLRKVAISVSNRIGRERIIVHPFFRIFQNRAMMPQVCATFPG